MSLSFRFVVTNILTALLLFTGINRAAAEEPTEAVQDFFREEMAEYRRQFEENERERLRLEAEHSRAFGDHARAEGANMVLPDEDYYNNLNVMDDSDQRMQDLQRHLAENEAERERLVRQQRELTENFTRRYGRGWMRRLLLAIPLPFMVDSAITAAYADEMTGEELATELAMDQVPVSYQIAGGVGAVTLGGAVVSGAGLIGSVQQQEEIRQRMEQQLAPQPYRPTMTMATLRQDIEGIQSALEDMRRRGVDMERNAQALQWQQDLEMARDLLAELEWEYRNAMGTNRAAP